MLDKPRVGLANVKADVVGADDAGLVKQFPQLFDQGGIVLLVFFVAGEIGKGDGGDLLVAGEFIREAEYIPTVGEVDNVLFVHSAAPKVSEGWRSFEIEE